MSVDLLTDTPLPRLGSESAADSVSPSSSIDGLRWSPASLTTEQRSAHKDAPMPRLLSMESFAMPTAAAAAPILEPVSHLAPLDSTHRRYQLSLMLSTKRGGDKIGRGYLEALQPEHAPFLNYHVQFTRAQEKSSVPAGEAELEDTASPVEQVVLASAVPLITRSRPSSHPIVSWADEIGDVILQDVLKSGLLQLFPSCAKVEMSIATGGAAVRVSRSEAPGEWAMPAPPRVRFTAIAASGAWGIDDLPLLEVWAAKWLPSCAPATSTPPCVKQRQLKDMADEQVNDCLPAALLEVLSAMTPEGFAGDIAVAMIALLRVHQLLRNSTRLAPKNQPLGHAEEAEWCSSLWHSFFSAYDGQVSSAAPLGASAVGTSCAKQITELGPAFWVRSAAGLIVPSLHCWSLVRQWLLSTVLCHLEVGVNRMIFARCFDSLRGAGLPRRTCGDGGAPPRSRVLPGLLATGSDEQARAKVLDSLSSIPRSILLSIEHDFGSSAPAAQAAGVRGDVSHVLCHFRHFVWSVSRCPAQSDESGAVRSVDPETVYFATFEHLMYHLHQGQVNPAVWGAWRGVALEGAVPPLTRDRRPSTGIAVFPRGWCAAPPRELFTSPSLLAASPVTCFVKVRLCSRAEKAPELLLAQAVPRLLLPHAPRCGRWCAAIFTAREFLDRYRVVSQAARLRASISVYPPAASVSTVGFSRYVARLSLSRVFSDGSSVRLLCALAGVICAELQSGEELECLADAMERAPSTRAAVAQMSRCIPESVALIADTLHTGWDGANSITPGGVPLPVVYVKSTRLVRVYSIDAMEQLRSARAAATEALRAEGLVVVQSFLRARWSMRWNFAPLLRRALRFWAMVIQANLRAAHSARLVDHAHAEALRTKQLLREFREGQRRHREQLTRRMELETNMELDVSAGFSEPPTLVPAPPCGSTQSALEGQAMQLAEEVTGVVLIGPGHSVGGAAQRQPPLSLPGAGVAVALMPSVPTREGSGPFGDLRGVHRATSPSTLTRAPGESLVPVAACFTYMDTEERELRLELQLAEGGARRAILRADEELKRVRIVQLENRARDRLQKARLSTRIAPPAGSTSSHAPSRDPPLASSRKLAATAAVARCTKRESTAKRRSSSRDGSGSSWRSASISAERSLRDGELTPAVALNSAAHATTPTAVPGAQQAHRAAMRGQRKGLHSLMGPLTSRGQVGHTRGVNSRVCGGGSLVAWRIQADEIGALEQHERGVVAAHAEMEMAALCHTFAVEHVEVGERLSRRMIFLAGLLERKEMLTRWKEVILPWAQRRREIERQFVTEGKKLSRGKGPRGPRATATSTGPRRALSQDRGDQRSPQPFCSGRGGGIRAPPRSAFSGHLSGSAWAPVGVLPRAPHSAHLPQRVPRSRGSDIVANPATVQKTNPAQYPTEAQSHREFLRKPDFGSLGCGGGDSRGLRAAPFNPQAAPRAVLPEKRVTWADHLEVTVCPPTSMSLVGLASDLSTCPDGDYRYLPRQLDGGSSVVRGSDWSTAILPECDANIIRAGKVGQTNARQQRAGSAAATLPARVQ